MSSKGTKTYNRSDIELELLSQFPDLTKKQIRLAIDSIIESIVDSVAFDEKVELTRVWYFFKKIYKTKEIYQS